MMRIVLSTDEVVPRARFKLWREITREHFVPSEQARIGEGIFEGRLEAARIGSLLVTRATFGALRTEVTPATIRMHDKQDTLAVTIKLAGTSHSRQDDRDSTQTTGDICVLDSSRPAVLSFAGPTRSLVVELPRSRLEDMLGPVRRYASTTIAASQQGTSLVTTFFDELIRVHERLDADAASRISSIAADLIVAGIAERLALDVPGALHGTVVVQRAKAYVEANLGDPTLDPSTLAAAMGVPLRRLQELFRERGRHVSEWIWERRLAAAEVRLADPGFDHLPITSLAFGCGFSSPAHFSRRFRDRYGMTPSEKRHAAPGTR